MGGTNGIDGNDVTGEADGTDGIGGTSQANGNYGTL